MSLSRRTPLRAVSERRLRRQLASIRTSSPGPIRCAWCSRATKVTCRIGAKTIGWCAGCAADKADEVVGQFVRKRDGGCVRCGTRSGLTWAHIIPRGRAPRLRWVPENTVAACWPCHAELDHHPAYKANFFEELFPGRQDELRSLALRLPRPDLTSVIETYAREDV